MDSATLQDEPPVESFFNVAETETLALLEHLSFEFLAEFDVFAPATVRAQAWYREFRECVLKFAVYNIERACSAL